MSELKQSEPNQPANQPKSSMMAKKTWLLLAAAVLVILVIAGLVAHKSSPTKPAATNPPAAPAASAKVSLDASGFTPETLQVKPNTQVTWTNTDTKPHQVAADPYPKNDSIPGFDSSQTLLTNDSYSFTFKTAGTYHLHDQTDPLNLHETVIVK